MWYGSDEINTFIVFGDYCGQHGGVMVCIVTPEQTRTLYACRFFPFLCGFPPTFSLPNLWVRKTNRDRKMNDDDIG